MDKVKHSVLIVDDQEASIAVLNHILSQEYKVYTADNGEKGIEAAENYMPDVILLDILMNGMDGYAVITELKKSEKTKNIPVIFITSLSGDINEEKGLALGAADYISKPFSGAIVKLRVRNQIKIIEQLRTIERLSMLDQLTDLPNRRSFENRLNAEWGRALRENLPISILVIDVDRFKIYNDTYGHQQGDIALQAFAKIFTQALKRPSDFAARWGGEEFIVLLPNTDLNGALEIAEQIRKITEETEIPVLGGPSASITVSIGVSVRSQGCAGTLDEFISGADSALYDAKKNGRNRVCYFGEY